MSHIVPLAMNVSLSAFEKHSNLDWSWNMIVLSEVLHDWWRQGLWGFTFLDIRSDEIAAETAAVTTDDTMTQFATIVLQFHWMPWATNGTDCRSEGFYDWIADVQEAKSTQAAADGLAHMESQAGYRRYKRIGKAETWAYKWLTEKRELDKATPPCSRARGVADAETGEPLVSGKLIKIRLPVTDVPKIKALIEVQWACVQMLSLSGQFKRSVDSM
jgi:hypothetical protein